VSVSSVFLNYHQKESIFLFYESFPRKEGIPGSLMEMSEPISNIEEKIGKPCLTNYKFDLFFYKFTIYFSLDFDGEDPIGGLITMFFLIF